MDRLIIKARTGEELVSVSIQEFETDELTIAVLKAIKSLPLRRKERSDKGQQKGPRKPRILPSAANPQPNAA